MRKTLRKTLLTTAVFCAATAFGLLGEQTKVSKAADVEINETNFKDKGVLNAANSADYNGDKNGILSDKEAATVKDISVWDETDDISWAVKYFPNLESVYISEISDTETLNIGSKKIKSISIYSTSNVVSLIDAAPKEVYISLTGDKSTFDFSKATGYENVTKLRIYGNENITKVIPANQSKLNEFKMDGTSVSSYNASDLKNITTLDLSGNKLTSLNVSKNNKLTSLSCYSNKLSSLNLKSNTNLHDIGVGYNNLSKLDVSKNKKIVSVVAFSNKLKGITAPKNSKITRINLCKNKVTSFSPKQYNSLYELYIANNSIKSLDISKNSKLCSLDVAGTKIKKVTPAKSARFNYISVGSNYDVLKPIKLQANNTYIQVYFNIAKGKSVNLPKIMPALKGYKFTNEDCQNITVSSSGVIKALNNEFGFFNAKKGKQSIYITVNGGSYY